MVDLKAHDIVVTGRVQGVGFRPFVSRIAVELGVTGWVRNRSGEVEIHVEGSAAALADFRRALIECAPPLARPDTPRVRAVVPLGLTDFVIEDSGPDGGSGMHIPPDYFVCDECLAEMHDPAERRYRYPFINCTQCGPRYTLIDRLPYDRPNTAMRDFRLCSACRTEYQNPLDRRYHAQPLACPTCGPRLLFRRTGQPDIRDNLQALDACVDSLRRGGIVAVKGIGGYHLLCDAGEERVVGRLRTRKNRPDKPLAVLVPCEGVDGLRWVAMIAEPDPAEWESLKSPLRPIVLVKRRAGNGLAAAIAPGLGEVGVMLPYSPLHHLLAGAFGAPLVATSGNISGEPVLTDGEEVEARLAHVADAFLHHDRPIRRPADDSVLRRIGGKLRPVRLGRGLAPVECLLPRELSEPWLAVGADLKNTVALGFDRRVVISPHIGDLGSLRSTTIFERVIADLQTLYQLHPRRVACDAHPHYRSSRWARSLGIEVREVFHHHAHASALVGEHGLAGASLIFTWDGTGYGDDGTIWGGEALLGYPGLWRRVGSLRPFRLPGGDRASREPWRCALALCWEVGMGWPNCPRDAELLQLALERGINSPIASSAGRLFDAAAALVGLSAECSYEGQAAMRLEALSDPSAQPTGLPLRDHSGVFLIDWEPLLPMLLDEGLSVPERASIFHASLAAAIVTQAERVREQSGVNQVGLTGGVFQNRILTEQAVSLLGQRGFSVFLPEKIPTNDAGISYGQIIEAAAAISLP